MLVALHSPFVLFYKAVPFFVVDPVLRVLCLFCNFQVQFSQIRSPGAMTPLQSGAPGFHPGAPRLAPQQLYFGQGTPGLMPTQPAAYGFQQQLVPGMRPVAPNFIMPYQLQRQGQPGQRMGGVRRGGNSQQMQHQQQSVSHSFSFFYA